MNDIILRAMQKKDWSEVADLIYLSTNYWYETHAISPAFSGGPTSTMLFCEVYESLDPGWLILAEIAQTVRSLCAPLTHLLQELHVLGAHYINDC